MGKKTVFTNITPLPPSVTREVAVAMLHNHEEMIELNPLVIEHHPIKTPRDAPKDEFLDCAWHEITDRISYMPGGMVKGRVTYKGCFHDMPNGLQTHVYAPLNLDIREKWTVCGSLPGEPEEARELGLNTPRKGLYLREDGEMKCNVLMTNFVRKNLDNAHKVLVDRILLKAERVQTHVDHLSTNPSETSSIIGSPIITYTPGSRMANLVRQMSEMSVSSPSSPSLIRQEQPRESTDSAAMFTARSQLSSRDNHSFVSELPVSQPGNADGAIQPQGLTDQDPEELHAVHPALREQYRQTMGQSTASNVANNNVNGATKRATPPTAGKSFTAIELEGSSPELRPSSKSSKSPKRAFDPIELDAGWPGPPPTRSLPPVPKRTKSRNGNSARGAVSTTSSSTPTTLNEDPVYAGTAMPGLAHMRSYSQPMLEANTYISTASGAHNLEVTSNTISGHPVVNGGPNMPISHGRFRGISNPGARSDFQPGMLSSVTGTVIPHYDYSPVVPQMPRIPAQFAQQPRTNTVLTTNTTTSTDSNDSSDGMATLDRFSIVSDLTEMPTPRTDQPTHAGGHAEDRYSMVSDLTDGIPTPRLGNGNFPNGQHIGQGIQQQPIQPQMGSVQGQKSYIEHMRQADKPKGLGVDEGASRPGGYLDALERDREMRRRGYI